MFVHSALEPIVSKVSGELGRDVEVTELGTDLWNSNESCSGSRLSPPERVELVGLLDTIKSVAPDVVMG